MTFDITGYLKYVHSQADLFMLSVLDKITKLNPSFTEDLKKDKDLFNPDGSPILDVPKELIDKKISDILNNSNFKNYELDLKTIQDKFLISEETLNKFIITDEN